MSRISGLPRVPESDANGTQTARAALSGVSRRTAFVALAAPALIHADPAMATVQAGTNFRATFAEALIDFPVGAYFSSAETGELRIYRRIASAPGYEDQGEGTAPVTRSALQSSQPEMGASLVSFGDQSVSERLGQIKSLLDALSPTERADVQSGTPTIDVTAQVNAFLASNIHVSIPSGTFLVDHIEIPASLASLRANGMGRVTFKRKPGATGPMFRCPSGRNTHSLFEGIYLIGNKGSGETCGFDLTGIAYSTFMDCRSREFTQDGWFADGVTASTNRQMSNNIFINCVGNNNGRDGIRLTGSSSQRSENAANTFIGCEFSGNTGGGVNGDICDSNQWIGCTAQGNTGRDVYFNSRYSVFTGYTEGNPRPVEMGPLSHGCEVKICSSYPLWNSFLDMGNANNLSVMGEIEPEQHLFFNPCFEDWSDTAPAGMSLQGTPVLTSYADAGSPVGAGLQILFNANFQGVIFTIGEKAAEIQGKWVTLILEVDTSGVADTLQQRVYARDGKTRNTTAGEFAVETMPIRSGLQTWAFDVRFAATISGAPNIIWEGAYDGTSAGHNVVKVRSARVVRGQTRKASFPPASGGPPQINAAQLGVAGGAINMHRKYAGKMVLDSSAGKMRFALGSAPTSAWRAFDGSGDLIPG